MHYENKGLHISTMFAFIATLMAVVAVCCWLAGVWRPEWAVLATSATALWNLLSKQAFPSLADALKTFMGTAFNAGVPITAAAPAETSEPVAQMPASVTKGDKQLGNIISNNTVYVFTHLFGEQEGTVILADVKAAAEAEVASNGSAALTGLETVISAKLTPYANLLVAKVPPILRPFATFTIQQELPNLIKSLVSDAGSWATSQAFGSTSAATEAIAATVAPGSEGVVETQEGEGLPA